MREIQTYLDLDKPFDKLINGDMYAQETNDTYVIYHLFNINDQKAYIGKAKSYVKNGNEGVIYHSMKGRFYKHWKAAMNGSDECPKLYKAMRSSESTDWMCQIIKVCSAKHASEREECATRLYETFDEKKGYNYMVGDKAPLDKQTRQEYSINKSNTNKSRSVGGALRKNHADENLPENIYSRKTGFNAQVKHFVNGETVAYSKAFLSAKYSREEKLQFAIDFLAKVKDQVDKLNAGEEIPEDEYIVPQGQTYKRSNKKEVLEV